MTKIRLTILTLTALISMLFSVSCDSKKHFINDSDYRNLVEKQFALQHELAKNRDSALFTVFKSNLSLEEEEALKFLYAYMPLSDLADYDGDFFLRNVRTTFAARDSFSWGKTIPEEIFRHFVLPVRVNNENLDTARMVFFNELKGRVKNLNMKDAVLEVNHWCHEKVTYKSTDARTSSPLNTVKTSYGRCGEESTLTAAALRAVGIPARQCYTPRWAHSDDNHAWVEVWVDGKWHYIGACEPDYDLDLAWFTGPAKRAMLVGTNVYGDYNGPEEILFKNEYYTRINLLSNYAPTKTFTVKAILKNGKPADSAEVEFCLYNYSEFYPIARKYADKNGFANLTTGLGDLLVWVNDGKDYGFEKVTVESTDTVIIRLGEGPQANASFEYDLIPPVERSSSIPPDEKKKEQNNLLLRLEDSIRNLYMATFVDSVKSVSLADQFKLNRDSIWEIMNKSEGNWKEMEIFIKTAPANYKHWVLPLLFSLATKDLHDVPASVLMDNLNHGGRRYNSAENPDKDIYIKYVMCPRIANENLKSYKSMLENALMRELSEVAPPLPEGIFQWINSKIKINTIANYYNVSITPKGSFELKVCDKHSRDILFVAICRSFGIPARIETSTRKPQFLSDKVWMDVNFDQPEKKTGSKGTLKLIKDPGMKAISPKYSTHYTFAFFRDGKFKTLDYEESSEVSELPATLTLDAGRYLMVSGTRQADGSVLSLLEFFDIADGQQTNITVKLRENPSAAKVLGLMDMDQELVNISTSVKIKLGSVTGGKTAIIIWIDPDKEPTKHVLAEIRNLKANFEKWGGALVLLLSDKMKTGFDSGKYKDLPSQKNFLVDQAYSSLSKLETLVKKQMKSNLPVVVVINGKGEVIFVNAGYNIGTGEQLLKVVMAN